MIILGFTNCNYTFPSGIRGNFMRNNMKLLPFLPFHTEEDILNYLYTAAFDVESVYGMYLYDSYLTPKEIDWENSMWKKLCTSSCNFKLK